MPNSAAYVGNPGMKQASVFVSKVINIGYKNAIILIYWGTWYLCCGREYYSTLNFP